jgi:hypothetical protein
VDDDITILGRWLAEIVASQEPNTPIDDFWYDCATDLVLRGVEINEDAYHMRQKLLGRE